MRGWDGLIPVRSLCLPGRQLPLGKQTWLMGIVNVTPDSFSDGGHYLETEAAVQQAKALIAAGADLIDLGAESTRPDNEPVPADVELERLLPVLRRLVRETSTPVSVDTWKAEVADAAIQSGAALINDIFGLQGDPEMAAVVARSEAAVILMHNATRYRNKGDAARFPQAMRLPELVHKPDGDTLVDTMVSYLQTSVQLATSAGICRQRLILDPGIGFGLNVEENLLLLRHLDVLQASGLPVLVGVSRKRFIRAIVGDATDRVEAGTAAVHQFALTRGVQLLRLHQIQYHEPHIRMSELLLRAERTEV